MPITEKHRHPCNFPGRVVQLLVFATDQLDLVDVERKSDAVHGISESPWRRRNEPDWPSTLEVSEHWSW